MPVVTRSNTFQLSSELKLERKKNWKSRQRNGIAAVIRFFSVFRWLHIIGTWSYQYCQVDQLLKKPTGVWRLLIIRLQEGDKLYVTGCQKPDLRQTGCFVSIWTVTFLCIVTAYTSCVYYSLDSWTSVLFSYQQVTNVTLFYFFVHFVVIRLI